MCCLNDTPRTNHRISANTFSLYQSCAHGFQNFLDYLVKQGHLRPDYIIYALCQVRPFPYSPGESLYRVIQSWPHWVSHASKLRALGHLLLVTAPYFIIRLRYKLHLFWCVASFLVPFYKEYT